jgi:F5/8 type C domain
VSDGTIEDAVAVARNEAPASPPAPHRRSTLLALTNLGRRVLDWLWCANALRSARATLATRSSEQLELLRRARLALEVGDRVLEPVIQPRHGSAAGHAAGLFREAIRWGAQATRPTLPGNDTALRQTWLDAACRDPEPQAALERLMSLPDPSEFFAALEQASQQRTALFLRGCAVRLLEASEAPQREVQRLLALRLVRLAVLPVVIACLLLGAWVFKPERPDLARGKPWRTSSVFAVCQPDQGLCGGAHTLILFHTNLEENPWFEYDLGADTHFSAMTIRDRSDSEQGRAVPLIVEVSNDGQSYREIARREHDFDVWRPSFAPQLARYVRLRVPRRTFLHLEEVKIHP